MGQHSFSSAQGKYFQTARRSHSTTARVQIHTIERCPVSILTIPSNHTVAEEGRNSFRVEARLTELGPYLRPGQSGTVAFAGIPWTPLRMTLSKITPVTDAQNQVP
jgi:hypothetical protein